MAGSGSAATSHRPESRQLWGSAGLAEPSPESLTRVELSVMSLPPKEAASRVALTSLPSPKEAVSMTSSASARNGIAVGLAGHSVLLCHMLTTRQPEVSRPPWRGIGIP